MLILSNTKAIEKITAQTDQSLQPVEAMLREWYRQMAPAAEDHRAPTGK